MHPAHCHHCNYDLTGLPAQGRCPECGKPFNTQSYYRQQHRSDHPLMRYLRSIVLAGIALAIVLFGSLLSIAADHPLRAVVITLVIAAVPAFGALVYWRSELDEQRKSD